MTVSPEATAPSRTAIYVYGVVPAPARTDDAPVGVGGAPAFVEQGAVAALVSSVPVDEFGDEALPTRLDDLEWVEANVRAHERVLEWALANGPVVPFRFCTLYRSDTQVQNFLAAHAPELRDVLERVRGTVERGVKAFVDSRRLEGTSRGEEGTAASASGRDYMLGRLRERELADTLERFRHEWAAHAHARLRAAALDGTLLDLQPRELTARADEMLLNGAYLVRPEDPAFLDVVETLAAEGRDVGVTVQATGPWPPYNFVPRELGKR